MTEEEYSEEDIISGEEEDISYPSGPEAGQVQSQSTVDRFFNTEAFLYHLKMSLLGYKVENGKYINTGRGLARTEAIEKLINSLRSVINPGFMLSRFKNEDDANVVLLEKCKEVIYMLYDEESVDGLEVEHITNIIDHSLQLFIGVIQSGEGGERATQMNTGNYQNLQQFRNQDSQAAFSIGNDNVDFFNFWKPKK